MKVLLIKCERSESEQKTTGMQSRCKADNDAKGTPKGT